MPSTFLHALNQATEPSVSQALLLGIALVLLFPISVYSTGYAAKKLNVLDAGYTEALWATVFKNVSAVVALALFSSYLFPHPAATLLLVGAVFPVVIYWRVFLSTIRQAAAIWLIVVVVEVAAGVCLVLGAILFGGWLDERYDLNSLFAAGACCWSAASFIGIPARHPTTTAFDSRTQGAML
jgi:hypothetical protein